MKDQTFKRAKKTWSAEADALQNVMQKQFVTEDELEAEHTETHFVWNRKAEEATGGEFQSWKISIKRDIEEKQAIDLAIKFSDTSEGNLQRLDTETHFVFKQVRG